MADPTFQVRGEPGHTHPEKSGGGGEAGSPKNSFWPFGFQFGLKIRRRPTPPGPSPGSTTDNNNSTTTTTTTTTTYYYY